MRYQLAELAKRARNPRRKSITLRDIPPPAMFASNLYARCYRPVVTLWTNALPRIMVQYERTLSSMTTDAPTDVQAAIDGTADDFLRLLIELIPELRDWVVRTEAWQRDKWRAAVLSATGVDLLTLLGPQDVRETLETVIARNTALIKDVSAQAQARISNAVFQGLTQRTPAAEVAKQIREATGMARRRSLSVASDQLNKLTNTLADERRREAGINEWEWVWSRKKHGRETHIARNGKVYSDNNPPPEMPGQLPYCGCRSKAVLTFD